jgi:hypothetical protein
MDEELKNYLDAKFAEARTETRADIGKSSENVRADTRQDLIDMEERLMSRIGGRLDAVESRVRDFIAEADRDLETKVIGEFWKWGRTADIRTRQALSETGLLNERMLSVEDRISALERQKAT